MKIAIHKILINTLGGEDWDKIEVHAHKLKEKLKERFDKDIIITKGSNVRDSIICSSFLSLEEVLAKQNFTDSKKLEQIKETAFHLCNVISKGFEQGSW